MATTRPRKGPWFARFLIYVFTALFGVLFFWLLSFVMSDIGTWPGPDYTALERERLDAKELDRARDLERQIAGVRREIEDLRQRQQTLRDSTSNSQTTINQLRVWQRPSVEKGATPSPEEQRVFSESQAIFLANQQKYQELNEDLMEQNEALRDLEDELRTTNDSLDKQRAGLRQEFGPQLERHRLQLGLVKLAVLVPLLLVGVVVFLRHRDSIYVPLVYAYSLAVAVRVMIDMHEYFPSRYFKYVLILTFLAIVTKILIALVRAVAHPRRDALLKQFREAYEAFQCPVCSYPIRRGPLKYLVWSRRSLKKLRTVPSGQPDADAPYSCPCCGARLFEECGTCHGVRHSLLPTCDKCGATKPIEAGTGGPASSDAATTSA